MDGSSGVRLAIYRERGLEGNSSVSRFQALSTAASQYEGERRFDTSSEATDGQFSLVALTALLGAASAQKISHSTAVSRLNAAGITVSSSGGCSDRNTPTCTSLDQVRSVTIDGAVTLKGACNCEVRVTGGTEVGHADGQYSHYNGYKLDFSLTSGLGSYIKNTFTRIADRGSYPQWQAASGNVYCVSGPSSRGFGTVANVLQEEGNHWDVTFYTDGN